MSKAAAAFILCLLPLGLDAAHASEGPALEVFAYRESGGVIAWDFSLLGMPAELSAGVVRFKPVQDGAKTLELPLTGKPAIENARLSLKTETPIGEAFADGFYTLELELRAGPNSSGAVRKELGMLVVKNTRRHLSFMPFDKKHSALPPELQAFTEADKQAQREAGEKLRKELLEAAKKGGTFKVPPGHYRFSFDPNNPEQAKGRKGAVIWIQDVQDFVLEAQGATFWFDSHKFTAIALDRCRNVTIRDLTVDYDPLPYVQGEILALEFPEPPAAAAPAQEEMEGEAEGAEEGEAEAPKPAARVVGKVRFRLDPGFESSTAAFKVPNPGFLRAQVFYGEEARGRVIKPNWVAGHSNHQPIKEVEPGVYETALRLRYDYPEPSGVAVGDSIVFCPRFTGNGFALEDCGGMRFERVTVHAAGQMVLRDMHAKDVNVYDRFRAVRRPNTRRLVCNVSDGLHFKPFGPGPKILGCTLETIMDDAIAMNMLNPHVVKVLSPTELVVAQRTGSTRLGVAPGMSVSFHARSGLHDRGRREVLAIDKCEEEGLKEREAAKKLHAWQPSLFYKLTLKEGVEAQENDMLAYPEEKRGQGFQIEDTYIYSNWGRGIIVSGANGVIRGNVLERSGRMRLGPMIGGSHGAFATDLLVENNRLIELKTYQGYMPIDLDAGTASAEGRTERVNARVTLRGNRVEGATYCGIHVADVAGLVLEGNFVTGANRTAHDPAKERIAYSGAELNHGIVVRNCSDTKLDGNRVEAGGPAQKSPLDVSE
ncbi:MAG: right-handed parallel beta-helix repeat-containing protein [Planctomycetota bacterium]|nr:right-handed parallel beta-helix repeat-containing protein [Planctomycetota bacterium]